MNKNILKSIALTLAMLLLLGGCAATEAPEVKAETEASAAPAEQSVPVEAGETVTAYQDGVYEGTATVDEPDYSYTASATVTVENGLITNIETTCDSPENELYMQMALKGMKDNIIAQQDAEVDIKSGATASSDALTKAVNDALSKAPTVEIAAPAQTEAPAETEEPAQSEAPASQAPESAQPTGSVEVLGSTYYYGDAAVLSIDGVDCEAEEIGSTGIFCYSEAPLTGEIYATCDMRYADFYYGELYDVEATTELDVEAGDAAADMRQAGMYDAVTSATRNKWQMGTAYYTQALEEGGGEILGLLGISVAVDADMYAKALALLDAGLTDEDGILTQISALTINDDQTAVPAQYKTLYGSGLYSAMNSQAAEATTLTYTTASITNQSRYGTHQINLSSGSGGGFGGQSGAAVLGCVLETEDGGKYGLKQLENIWQNGRELAISTRVSRFEDIVGKTIVKITFIVAGQQDYVMDVNLTVE